MAMPSKQKSKKTRTRFKTIKEDYVPNYNIPGVQKLVLSDLTQKHLEIIVGDHVTSEYPWKDVPKTTLRNELQVVDTDIHPIQDWIMDYPENKVLVGYVPDEAAEVDEFYICTTPEVRATVQEMAARVIENQERKLFNAIYKKLGKWQSHGSEKEVKELCEDQRFRALFEVEIDCRFPVIGEEIKFRNRDADDVHDGYAEILPGRQTFENVQRARVDALVQVGLTTLNKASQTQSTFPTNVWTQYLYEYELPEAVPVILAKGETRKQTPLEKFLGPKNLDPVYDQLIYNSCVNLYEIDYPNLKIRQDYVEAGEQLQFEEYMSFADIGVCQDKQIASVSWHHMWSGVVACAYVDAATASSLKCQQNVDEVYRAVHGANPVLLWSFQDSLEPKIAMSAPREVRTIAFCPFNENILVGGCINGQVVIWDLTGKLSQIESVEILTAAQQKYRNIMASSMKWFKNIRDQAKLSCTVVSALETSHRGSVTEIRWLPPYFKLGRNGRFEKVPDGESTSTQFMTSAEDGEVLVWDLDMMPTGAQLAKSARVSRRLGRRLDALTLDVSKYKVLDRIFRPIFEFCISKDGKRNTPLSGLCTQRVYVKYEEIDPKPFRKLDGKTRVMYAPIVRLPEDCPVMHITAATVFGDVAMCNWLGYNFDGGANINSESCTFNSFCRVHDGPVTTIARSPFFEELTLTVGGKVMAIWREDFYNCPIMQRRSTVKITCCSWSLYRSSCFHIGREDGSVEIWDLLNRTDKPSLVQSISGKLITGIWTHRLPLENNVLGIADHRGTFRMFYIPGIYQENPDDGNDSANEIFLKAKWRKENVLKWQEAWKIKNTELLQKREAEYQLYLLLKANKLEKEAKRAEDLQRRKAADAYRKQLAESKPEPGKYSEWAHKRFEKIQERRMHNVLLKKKKLNRGDLVKHLAPLKRIADQIEYKKIKQEKTFSKKNKIFNDAVAISFPETNQRDENLDRQIAATKDPDDVQVDLETALEYFQGYHALEQSMKQVVNNEPYNYVFSWRFSLSQGKERRKTIDIGLNLNTIHRVREEEYEKNFDKKRLEGIPEMSFLVVDDLYEHCPGEDNEADLRSLFISSSETSTV